MRTDGAMPEFMQVGAVALWVVCALVMLWLLWRER